MNKSIVGRHFELTEPIKDYVNTALDGFENPFQQRFLFRGLDFIFCHEITLFGVNLSPKFQSRIWGRDP